MIVTAVIPAKGSSSRVKNKNLYKLDGKSLVYRACEKCLNCDNINNVYIDTESDEILNDVRNLVMDGLRIINRPKHLATNKTSGNDLIAFELDHIAMSDLVIHTYATSPLITSKTIDYCIDYFNLASPFGLGYDSFFSAKRMNEYLWYNNEPMNFCIKELPNSFELPEIWAETHGVYGIKYESLKQYKTRLTHNALPIEIPDMEILDINNPIDIDIMEALWT